MNREDVITYSTCLFYIAYFYIFMLQKRLSPVETRPGFTMKKSYSFPLQIVLPTVCPNERYPEQVALQQQKHKRWYTVNGR